MASAEKNSARLRNAEKISRLCGFRYDRKKNQYGRYFSAYELEQIAERMEQLTRTCADQERELERLRAPGEEEDSGEEEGGD